MTTEDIRAALVTEVGQPPQLGRKLLPDVATSSPPGWPIEFPNVPRRSPGPHPASLIEVTYAALNPVDLHIAAGHFFQGPPTTLPYVPGVEGAGRIVESGAYPAGTRVRFELGHAGYGGDGALAEFVVADDAGLVALPDEVPDAEAAAVGVAATAALRALDIADMVGGETVLVLGATGSIGQLALQLARNRGAGRVIAAGRREFQLARALELGADVAISLNDKTSTDLTAEIREAGGGGIDVIIDPLWGEPAMAALAAGNLGVRLANFGQAASSSTGFSSIALRNNRATVRGISTAMDSFDVRRACCAEAVRYLEQGQLSVAYEVHDLDDVGAVWAAQAKSPGRKLLLKIGQEEAAP